MKIRKRIIEYVAMRINHNVVRRVHTRIKILQRQRRMGLHSVSAAIKLYLKYRMKVARPYGATLEFRLRNQIRREFTFVAACE